MFRDWSFWSVLWLVVNILIWLIVLQGGGWAARAILRQLRSEPSPHPDESAPTGKSSGPHTG